MTFPTEELKIIHSLPLHMMQHTMNIRLYAKEKAKDSCKSIVETALMYIDTKMQTLWRSFNKKSAED
jgi:hypothetical protein